MKIAHFSDLHYSQNNALEADRCFSFAVQDTVRRASANLAVISGDSTDHRLDANACSLHLLASNVHTLAHQMPVLMLQGTFSHEPPGTLDNFTLMGAPYPVYVADRIHQVALHGDVFRPSAGALFSPEEIELLRDLEVDVVFTCVPTVNKAALAAAVGVDAAATELGEHLALYLSAAGAVNMIFRGAGIPTVGVSHGTVHGCQTEHGVPMIGFDHEFTVGSLFDAQCDAFMLGHIHKSQRWTREGRTIAYAGSIGRFHYGEEGEKGYLLWDVEAGCATAQQIATPARITISVDFNGPPDMERLEAIARDSTDKFVRVRWQVDEEHRQLVDRSAIAALFAHAAELKLEPRILPSVRSRAAGISNADTLGEKLSRWATLTETPAPPLQDRLALLESADIDQIVASVLASLTTTPSEASPAVAVASAEPDITSEPAWLWSGSLFDDDFGTPQAA
ncbi:Exonuclease SbcD (plasmid) [Pararobbsia alpina]|uniref:metallophosphoesterase family protein n=1 Tax=Pararobbsia alpina TaxID=621374 RepID=UPI0039A7577E